MVAVEGSTSGYQPFSNRRDGRRKDGDDADDDKQLDDRESSVSMMTFFQNGAELLQIAAAQ